MSLIGDSGSRTDDDSDGECKTAERAHPRRDGRALLMLKALKRFFPLATCGFLSAPTILLPLATSSSNYLQISL